VDPYLFTNPPWKTGLYTYAIEERTGVFWREDQHDGRGRKAVIYWKRADGVVMLYMTDHILFWNWGYTGVEEKVTLGPGQMVTVDRKVMLPHAVWKPILAALKELPDMHGLRPA